MVRYGRLVLLELKTFPAQRSVASLLSHIILSNLYQQGHQDLCSPDTVGALLSEQPPAPPPPGRSAAVLENTKKVRRTSQYPELVLYEDAAGHSLYVPPHQRWVLLTCPRTPSDNAFRHNSRTAAAVRRHCLLDTPHSRQNPALRSTPQALRAPHPEHKAVKLASLGNGKPRNPSSSLASRPYRPKKRLMC